jgi:hypothetical protein
MVACDQTGRDQAKVRLKAPESRRELFLGSPNQRLLLEARRVNRRTATAVKTSA